MSEADDILFAPLVKSDWRIQCRQIVEYIKSYQNAPRRNQMNGKAGIEPAPVGALLLEEMCELYHEHKQDIFWLVYVPSPGSQPVECREIYFNGVLTFDRYEDGGFPHLGSVSRFSIRDLNLVRNCHTYHHVFATKAEAHAYWKDVDV